MPVTAITDPNAPSPWDRPLVLLIEDNLTQLHLNAMILEDSCVVIRASRGEEGFAAAVRSNPDVIVLDILLPDMDGVALFHRLQADAATASIPVIVLTGDDASYVQAGAMCPGPVDVFRKPCAADVLIAAVHHAFERSQGSASS